MAHNHVKELSQKTYTTRMAKLEVEEEPHPFRYNYKKLTMLSREELQEVITEDTRAFLKSGKRIQKIPYGVKASDYETE